MAWPLVKLSAALAGQTDNMPEEFHFSVTNLLSSNLDGLLNRRRLQPLCYVPALDIHKSLPNSNIHEDTHRALCYEKDFLARLFYHALGVGSRFNSWCIYLLYGQFIYI